MRRRRRQPRCGACCRAPLTHARLQARAALPQGSDAEWLFCANRGKGRSQKRPLFQWTGRLRPFPISPYRPVPDGIARPDYATTGWPAEENESRKQNSVHIHTPAEVEGIRRACVLARALPSLPRRPADRLRRGGRCWTPARRRCDPG